MGRRLASLLIGLIWIASGCRGARAPAGPGQEAGQPAAADLRRLPSPWPAGSPIAPDAQTSRDDPGQATPEPLPSPRQVTRNGCCPGASWAADSSSIVFIDRPPDAPASGIYAVSVDGGDPTLIQPQIGQLSDDGHWMVESSGRRLQLRSLDGARSWLLPEGATRIVFDRRSKWIAWQVGSQVVSQLDIRQRQVWVADVEGLQAQPLAVMIGGGWISWVEGGVSLLASGRVLGEQEYGIWRLGLDGSARLIFPAERPRGLLLSPGGQWLAFYIAFEAEDVRNGLWIIRSDGTQAQRLPEFGSYRWRDDHNLVVIPWGDDLGWEGIVQYPVPGGDRQGLLPAESAPLPIANNEWSISPDGGSLLYLSADDRNLYVMPLPEP
jgi:hypothetical protein